jgi:hypothetical protein
MVPDLLEASALQILHHASRRRFVLMFHLDTPGFEAPAVGVAISPNITGTMAIR